MEALRLVAEATRDQLLTLLTSLDTDDLRSLIHRSVKVMSSQRLNQLRSLLLAVRGSEVERPTMSIFGLPREVCHLIFQHVDTITMLMSICRVGRAWREVAMSPESWSSLTFPTDPWDLMLKRVSQHLSQDRHARKVQSSPFNTMCRWASSFLRCKTIVFPPERSPHPRGQLGSNSNQESHSIFWFPRLGSIAPDPAAVDAQLLISGGTRSQSIPNQSHRLTAVPSIPAVVGCLVVVVACYRCSCRCARRR